MKEITQLGVLVFSILLALQSLSVSKKVAPKTNRQTSSKIDPKKALNYLNAAAEVAQTIKESAKQGEAVLQKYVNEVKQRPPGLLNEDTLAKEAVKGFLQSDKVGTRDISLRSNQGFGNDGNFQPAGFTLTQKNHPDGEKKKEPSEESKGGGVFNYPMGLGPVLFSGCFKENYVPSSPCFSAKKIFMKKGLCFNQLDAGNFIGVGFDGRGYYSAQSRKTSLVQRKCTAGSSFLDKQVPDVMNCFGIYDTKVETKTFQSTDEYMKYVREKAGVSNTQSIFKAEAEKMSKMTSFGGSLGAIGGIYGAVGGAIVGGPAGAVAGGAAGAAIGDTIKGGYGNAHGNSKTDKSGESKSSVEQSDKSSRNSGRTESFFATMTVSIILFEIALDEVTPNDLSFAMIRDYASLPSSYMSAGAEAKYQSFIVRWGTHYITSAKMGGKLTITKTSKADKTMSSSQFSEVAETEFQSMFANLQSSYSQKSGGFSILGIGLKHKTVKQKSSYEAGSTKQRTSKAKSSQDDAMKQSKFTHTMVAAEGGDPLVAQAIVDFYTPSFKDTLSNWLSSISDYPKPIQFTLRGLDDLLNLNMHALFPSGEKFDFGCAKNSKSIKLNMEKVTNKTFYYTEVEQDIGNETVKVYCKYNDSKSFQESFDRRHLSLEKAIAIYLKEGPFPTSNFDVKGGKPGCESARTDNIENSTAHPKWKEMQGRSFKVIFDTPADIPRIARKDEEFIVKKVYRRWFANRPNEKTMHIYEGCKLKFVDMELPKKICVKNLILTYDEESGFLRVTKQDFNYSLLMNQELPKWLNGSVVARAKVMSLTELTKGNKHIGEKLASPCHYKWMNSHRIDPNNFATCIHFSAATKGHIYVIFSSVPKDKHSWYYIYISFNGVSFYKGMELKKSEYGQGIGTLGDDNLYNSYFTCITQSKDYVISLQYGKADPDSEVGHVHAAHTFKGTGKKQSISYYTFGSGSSDISFHDVRITKKLPKKLECPADDYVLSPKGGHCVMDCHKECNGCKKARDNTQCDSCRNMRKVESKKLICLNSCPVGYTNSTTDANLCVKCSAGTYKNVTGNQACNKCHVGSYASKEGTINCKPCKIGTACAKTGCKTCTECSPGTFSSSPGQRNCLKCPNGSHIAESGASSCKSCKPGHYADREGLEKCLECKRNTFSDAEGAKSCKACLKGAISPNGASSCFNNCTKGSFSLKQDAPCQKCERGWYSPSAGRKSCLQCEVGHYQDVVGADTCKKCEPGTYQNETGAVECFKCRRGFFQDESGMSQCKQCEPGTYQDKTGSTGCNKCKKGTSASEKGSVTCEECAVGHYADKFGQANCSECRQGTYTNLRGTIQCNRCPAGTALNKLGGTMCIDCVPGTYQPKKGSTYCKNCDEGRFTPAYGSKSCHRKCVTGVPKEKMPDGSQMCIHLKQQPK